MRSFLHAALLATAAMGLMARAVHADTDIECDLAQLAGQAQPPARFADYTPDFKVVPTPIAYHWWRGGQLARHEDTVDVVMDGDRPIAILPNHFFGPYPGADTRGWIDETFSPRFRRFGVDITDGTPGNIGSARHEVESTGRELVFVVRRGADPQAGEGDGQLTRYILRVDPTWGYVLERHTQWRLSQAPVDRNGNPTRTFHAGMWYSGGITSVWPDEITYRFSGAAHQVSDDGPRYTVWSNNSESMFRPHHPTVRAGGFVANLRDRHGWGVALTHEVSASSRYSVCPIWGGFHPHLPLEVTVAEDGSVSGEVRQRIVTLPPEIVDHIIDNAQQVNAGGRVILIRPDGENFEDQPLSAGTVERGFQPDRTHGIDTGQNARISEAHARSGSRSLEVDGMSVEQFVNFRFFPRDRAHTRFLPGKTYRLECWVKVVGEDTEAFVIPTPALGVSPQRMADGEGVGTARTRSVREADGWQQVSLEFTGQLHGNPMNVRFIVLGEGRGYFDDFRIYRVDEAELAGH